MGLKVNVVVFLVTVLITITTTGLMSLAIWTEHWEVIHYDVEKINQTVALMEAKERKGLRMEVSHGGRVIFVKDGNSAIKEVLIQMHAGLWAVCYDIKDSDWIALQLIVQSKLQSDRCLEVTQSGITLSSDTSGSKSDGESNEDDHYDVAVSTTFPHMRHDIYEDDQNFPNPDLFGNNSRQLRMRNLCVSCSLVCLILLAASIFVFWVGIFKKQVPPVFVVSVLYILAAFFGALALTIMKFRRHSCADSENYRSSTKGGGAAAGGFGRGYNSVGGGGGGGGGNFYAQDCTGGADALLLDSGISAEFYPTRTFDQSWSLWMGWTGVVFCILSSGCVFVLSKLMRNGPLFRTSVA